MSQDEGGSIKLHLLGEGIKEKKQVVDVPKTLFGLLKNYTNDPRLYEKAISSGLTDLINPLTNRNVAA